MNWEDVLARWVPAFDYPLFRLGDSTEFPHRAGQNEPVVLMKEFGSSSVDWIVSIWIDDPRQLRGFRSQLNEAIWKALREAGITIVFPQLDVHFDPGIERSVAAMAGSSRPGFDR